MSALNMLENVDGVPKASLVFMSHNTFLPQKSVPGLFLKNCEPHGNIKDQISYLLPKQLGTLLKIPMN